MSVVLIAQLVNIIFEVYIWLVIIRCILSFFRHNPYQPLIRFVYEVTEPVMAPFRRFIPAAGGVDFSPIIVILVLTLLQGLVTRLIYFLF